MAFIDATSLADASINMLLDLIQLLLPKGNRIPTKKKDVCMHV